MIAKTPTAPPRVILVDDHPAVLEHVARLLSDDFEVVAALPDGQDLSTTVDATHPDFVVMDISLPGATGIELARRLAGTPTPPKIVFLTVHADADYTQAALATGALGYVIKSRLASDLVAALHAARDGRRFASPSPGLEEFARQPPDPHPAKVAPNT